MIERKRESKEKSILFGLLEEGNKVRGASESQSRRRRRRQRSQVNCYRAVVAEFLFHF